MVNGQNIRLSQYVKERFSEWRAELVRALPSVEILEAKPQRTIALYIILYTRAWEDAAPA